MIPVLTKVQSIDFILRKEGGYSNNPNDSGGPTKYGITIGTLSTWKGRSATTQEVKDLSIQEAIDIYDVLFWSRYDLGSMNIGVAHFMMDSIVQHGPKRPIKWLQKYAGVKQDGIIGPITLKAVSSCDFYKLVLDIAYTRGVYYEGLAHYPTFGKGWKKRLYESLMEATLSIGATDAQFS